MVLLELFDATHAYKIGSNTADRFDATFTSSSGYEIVVLIDLISATTWEVVFSQNVGTEINPKWKTDVTKKGDEYRIFGTVMKIVEEFIKEYSPEKLVFTADKADGNRYKLYDRMVKKHVPAGYEYDISHSDSNYRSYFVLRRVGA